MNAKRLWLVFLAWIFLRPEGVVGAVVALLLSPSQGR